MRKSCDFFNLKLQSFVGFLLLINKIVGSNGFPTELSTQKTQKVEESRHIPSTFDSGFVPLIPSQIDPNSYHNDDDDADDSSEFYPPTFPQRKFFSHFTSTFNPTIRPQSHRIFGRFASHPTTTRRPHYDKNSILGSGDFTVMRGGSFYGDGDDRPLRNQHEFYGSGSDGRPYALPLESTQHFPDDPFANFKDFADITGGAFETDFTHNMHVYVKKDRETTTSRDKHEPKNILEELQMIDDEKLEEEEKEKETKKKLSKFKSKLNSTKLDTKLKSNKMETTTKATTATTKISSSLKNYTEPLIAES